VQFVERSQAIGYIPISIGQADAPPERSYRIRAFLLPLRCRLIR
jgi:hypothetical protein